jgi:hypothetical protein
LERGLAEFGDDVSGSAACALDIVEAALDLAQPGRCRLVDVDFEFGANVVELALDLRRRGFDLGCFDVGADGYVVLVERLFELRCRFLYRPALEFGDNVNVDGD